MIGVSLPFRLPPWHVKMRKHVCVWCKTRGSRNTQRAFCVDALYGRALFYPLRCSQSVRAYDGSSFLFLWRMGASNPLCFIVYYSLYVLGRDVLYCLFTPANQAWTAYSLFAGSVYRGIFGSYFCIFPVAMCLYEASNRFIPFFYSTFCWQIYPTTNFLPCILALPLYCGLRCESISLTV